MNLSTFLPWANTAPHFNDIEVYSELRPIPDGLNRARVDSLFAFAQHRSASLYAMYGERVVWLDSEGEQYIIAANVGEFVDAMHLYAGSLWDAMSACQRTPPAPIEVLRARFDAAWQKDAIYEAQQQYEGYEEFSLWAASQGRSAPQDITSRLVALHTETQQLRALCAGAILL